MTTLLRQKLYQLVDEIVDAIESGATADTWIDQASSPLGRDRHLRLVRSGKLPGRKVGRRVLVRRSDLDRFIESKAVIRVDEKADEDREVARIVAAINRKRNRSGG